MSAPDVTVSDPTPLCRHARCPLCGTPAWVVRHFENGMVIPACHEHRDAGRLSYAGHWGRLVRVDLVDLENLA